MGDVLDGPSWAALQSATERTKRSLLRQIKLTAHERQAIAVSIDRYRESLAWIWTAWGIGAVPCDGRAKAAGLELAEVLILERGLDLGRERFVERVESLSWISTPDRSEDLEEVWPGLVSPSALRYLGSGALFAPIANQLPTTIAFQEPIAAVHSAAAGWRESPFASLLRRVPTPESRHDEWTHGVRSGWASWKGTCFVSVMGTLAWTAWFAGDEIGASLSLSAVLIIPLVATAVAGGLVIPVALDSTFKLMRRLVGRGRRRLLRQTLQPPQRLALRFVTACTVVASITPLSLLAAGGSEWPWVAETTLFVLAPLTGLLVTRIQPDVLYLAASSADAVERLHRIRHALRPLRVVSLVKETHSKLRSDSGRWTHALPDFLVFTYLEKATCRVDLLDNVRGPEDDPTWRARVQRLMTQARIIILDPHGVSSATADEVEMISLLIESVAAAQGQGLNVLLLADGGCAPLIEWSIHAGDLAPEYGSLRAPAELVKSICTPVGSLEEIPSAVAGLTH